MNYIRNVYIAHTINTVALSIIGIYIPIYLLTLGYSLVSVLIFFTITHVSGLLIGLFILVPLFSRYGIINTFRVYYPLQFIFLTFLFLLESNNIPLILIAVLHGASIYSYWMPLNLLFIKHSPNDEMGSNFAKLFALPQVFSIVGPLISAALIPIFGFWPVFVLTFIGVIFSFVPMSKVNDSTIKVSINLSSSIKRFMRNKSLFMLEALDNIIEESEWFWAIYVFIIIGNLSTPGILGSLSAVGGALFTLAVGKIANRKAKAMIPIGATLLFILFVLKVFVTDTYLIYVVTIATSFAMTMFLVSYFTTIYKTVKGDGEEEFVVLREIPTVIGRLLVFSAILVSASTPNLFFFFPAVFVILLLILYFGKIKLLNN